MARGHKRSAGLLLFRRDASEIEVLIAHMGGPYWEKKDEGGWSIPKGEYEDEDPQEAAVREFEEEIGLKRPKGRLLDLGEVRQPSGKRVRVWALEGSLDATQVASNTFEMEWPPRSGIMREFPEVDRAQWFAVDEARVKLLPGQVPFLNLLLDHTSR